MTEAPSVAGLLDQRESWYTREGGRVLLRDMDESHILNLLAWLERNAARIQANAGTHLYLTTAGHHGDAAQDAVDSMIAELSGDPLSWVRRQPLYEALMREQSRRIEPGEFTAPLAVGDVLHGFCQGSFGDSYDDKTVEAIGPDWVVCRETGWVYNDTGSLAFTSGDPQALCQYRHPVCPDCFHQGELVEGRCAQCGLDSAARNEVPW